MKRIDNDENIEEIEVSAQEPIDEAFDEEKQPLPKKTRKDKQAEKGTDDELEEFEFETAQNEEFEEDEQPLPKKEQRKMDKLEKKLRKKQEKLDKKAQKEAEKYEDESDDDGDNIINMDDIRRERKKEKSKKRLKKLLIILIIISLGLVAYITRDKWVYKLEGILDRKPDIIVNDGETQKGNFPIALNSTSVNVIGMADNNVVTADDSQIYLYDKNGKKVDSFMHNLGSPVVSVAGRKILVFDIGGKSFKVYNKNGELYSKTVDDNIIYAKISDDGYTAIVTQTEKFPSSMSVYDNNGSEIYKWSSGQRIMNISFEDNTKGCYVSTFTSDNGLISSTVHHIRFDSTEEKMTSAKLDTLVIDTLENNNGDIWAVGDDRFYKLDDKGNIVLEYEYTDDLMSYALNEYCAAVAVNGISKGTASVALFDADSDEKSPKLATAENGTPKRLVCSGKKIMLLSDRAVDAFNLKGDCIATVAASSDYTNFVYFDDAVYFLGYREINKTEFKN